MGLLRIRTLRTFNPFKYLFILYTFFATTLFALDPDKLITQYDIRIYTAKNGLPMNSLKCVFQDSNGFLWIGTQEGLVRFDGIEFKTFDQNAFTGLLNNFIWDIDEDSQGNLWVASQGGGIAKFDGKAFHSFTTADGLAHNNCFKVFADKETNSIWVGTENGLSIFSNERFFNPTLELNTSRNWLINSILRTADGRTFVGGYLPYVAIFNNSNVTYLNTHNGITSLHETDNGDILFGSQRGKIQQFGKSGLQILKASVEADYSTINCRILDILEDKDNNLWFATEGGGIVRYTQGKFDSLTTKNGLNAGGDFVTSIIEDNEGSLWFSTDGGLVQLFDNKFIPFGKKEGLPSEYGHNVCQDKEGNICIGLRDSGLSLLSTTTKEIKNFWLGEDLPHGEVTSLFPSNSKNLWIGTTSTNILHSLKNNVLSPPISYGIGNVTAVRSLFVSSNDDLYVGSRGFIASFRNNQFKTYFFHQAQEVSDVTCLIESENGDLWFGTYGLGLYKLRNEKITREGIYKELLTGGVNALYKDDENVMWIGTDHQGLYRHADGEYINFNTRDGLFSDRIFSILEDDSLNFWCSTNRGVFSVSKRQLYAVADSTSSLIQYNSYNYLDGMRESECNGRRQPSAWKSRDGKLWFSSMAGVVCIDPNNIPKNKVPPPVYIEYLKGDDNKIMDTKQPAKLALGVRNMEIKFTSPSFVIPERIEFKYILEGYDNDWQNAGTRRTAFYTNLDPKQYAFKVKAFNSDGVESIKSAYIQITVPQFWYETRWAFGLYVILATSVILLIGIWRSKRVLLKSQLALQKEHTTRLEELDRAKSRFFANITHEFRTPLTLILAPLQQLIDETTTLNVKRLYAVMHKNAGNLLNLINELLYLQKITAGKMMLRAELCNVLKEVKTITMSFLSLAERKNLNLSFNSNSNEILGYVDRDKLNKIITNLLSNAIKFSESGGVIRVSLNELDYKFKANRQQTTTFPNTLQSAKAVRIVVSDNGRGISSEKIPYIFNRFYQSDDSSIRDYEGTGIGLALVKELVELYHGEITLESTLGKGSIFTVILPIGKELFAEEEIIEGGSQENQTTYPKLSIESPLNYSISGPNDPDPELENKSPNENPQILVVEDNHDLLAFICDHLVDYFDVHASQNGKLGYERAVHSLPDLIISDVMMPEMDGFKLCQALKTDERTSHIPVILLTALADHDNKIAGLETKADDYIIKPFHVQELIARCINLIEQRKHLRERYSKLTISPKDIAVSRYDKQFLDRLINVAEENIANESFNIKLLAEKLGWSKRQVFRKIKSLTGLTPEKFIFDFRIKRAKQLVVESDYTISEISYQTGFSSQAHLSRVFRQYYKLSPTEYRVQHK